MDIARERDGQAEEAVFEGLVREEPHRRLVGRGLRCDVHDAAGRADVAGDVGTRRLAGPEGHRDGVDSRGEDVAFLLEYRAGREADAVVAGLTRDETLRVAVVRPVRGTEEGDFDRRVLGSVLGFQFIRLQRLIVTGEEHRLPVPEGIVLGEESRADDA